MAEKDRSDHEIKDEREREYTDREGNVHHRSEKRIVEDAEDDEGY